jgi:hypothetical protein
VNAVTNNLPNLTNLRSSNRSPALCPDEPQVAKKWVRISEASRQTGLPERLIRTRVDSGRLPSYQPFGNYSWRFVDLNSLPNLRGKK